MRVRATARFKTMQCAVCEKPLRVGSNTRNAPTCTDCTVTAVAENARQLHDRSGPYYEAWRNAILRL